MLVLIFACLLGIAVGVWMPVLPYEYTRYSAIAILAAFDSIIGAINAILKGNFNIKIFVSGFFVNGILAILLTALGDKLDVNIFLASIFVFVTRLFNNFSSIRRIIVSKLEGNQEIKEKKN